MVEWVFSCHHSIKSSSQSLKCWVWENAAGSFLLHLVQTGHVPISSQNKTRDSHITPWFWFFQFKFPFIFTYWSTIDVITFPKYSKKLLHFPFPYTSLQRNCHCQQTRALNSIYTQSAINCHNTISNCNIHSCKCCRELNNLIFISWLKS